MSDPYDPNDQSIRFKSLEDRIAKAKGNKVKKPQSEEHYSQANMAWRMVIELVAGLGIGFGIGYALDILFGTIPIFMVLFILLGFAAGIKTMMRSAAEMQNQQLAKQADKDEDD